MIYIKRINFMENKEYSYFKNIPALKEIIKGGSIEFTKDVTFFVGENGSGKSTLLDGIAAQMDLNLEGGSKNFTFSTRKRSAALADHIIVSKSNYPKDSFYFKAESFFNAATYIEEIAVGNNYGHRPMHEQSHGEKFLSLVKNRFCGNGLYLLDEPESALSPQSQLALFIEINYLVEHNSQFIISTHSPIILSYPNSTIYELSQSGISEIKYEDTECYSLYTSFLNNPEQYLKHLF